MLTPQAYTNWLNAYRYEIKAIRWFDVNLLPLTKTDLVSSLTFGIHKCVVENFSGGQRGETHRERRRTLQKSSISLTDLFPHNYVTPSSRFRIPTSSRLVKKSSLFYQPYHHEDIVKKLLLWNDIFFSIHPFNKGTGLCFRTARPRTGSTPTASSWSFPSCATLSSGSRTRTLSG